MKSKLISLVLLATFTLSLLSASEGSAKPLSQTISIQGQLTGPDSQGRYKVEGTYTATGYDEKYLTYIKIYAVFIDDSGTWPGEYTSQNATCIRVGQQCVDNTYIYGDTLGTFMIHDIMMAKGEEGVAMDFSGEFEPPAGATQVRFTALLDQGIYSGSWPAMWYRWAYLGPYPITPQNQPIQNQPSPNPTLTPTPGPTPPPGPCTIIVSPTSATVNAGAEVSFAGAAIHSSGVPMSNALLNIDCGNLDGSGCVSPARTDPAGNFSFTYAAPPNTNQASSVTCKISVEGCPVVVSVPITISGSSSSSGGTIPGVCPSPIASIGLIFGMMMLQNRKRHHEINHQQEGM